LLFHFHPDSYGYCFLGAFVYTAVTQYAILLKSDYQFKGALTENFVLQQLQEQFDVEPRFYADGRGEIDFMIQHGTEIIPVEVKSGESKSAASFKSYVKNKSPNTAIRYSKPI